MIKTKDFYLLKVYDIRGKYLGVVGDTYIDFYNGEVTGFLISNYMLFSKKNFANIKDIISIEEVIVVKSLTEKIGIPFRCIKDIDIKDKNNIMKGVLEELIIEKKDFSIKGLIVSSGIFDRMIKGKEILLLKNCILGEDFILYYSSEEVRLKSLPRKEKDVKL